MAEPIALKCVRCAKRFALAAHRRGCDACLAEGVAANLTLLYEALPKGAPGDLLGPERSMWRYAPLLHAPAARAVTLGEGLTPLLDGACLGLGPLWIKDEGRNPTWSFKDRLASAAVTMARSMGARVIAASSSGNAGAATAAYAARAGLPCIVLTAQASGSAMLTQMSAYGAMLLRVPSSPDRWKVLSAGIERYGWFPTTVYFGPAIGSNPMGVEGYKTIAFEVAEAMNWRVPDWFAVPACYGDSLYALSKGFQELRAMGWTDRVPRLLAAEVSGSLTQALAEGADVLPVCPLARPTAATSIGAPQGTYQGLAALRATQGVAVTVADAEILHWQARLGRSMGLYAEPAAVAALAAVARLRADGTIGEQASVVSLLTASGLKDNAGAETWLQPAPVIAPDLNAAVRALEEHYGYHMQ